VSKVVSIDAGGGTQIQGQDGGGQVVKKDDLGTSDGQVMNSPGPAADSKTPLSAPRAIRRSRRLCARPLQRTTGWIPRRFSPTPSASCRHWPSRASSREPLPPNRRPQPPRPAEYAFRVDPDGWVKANSTESATGRAQGRHRSLERPHQRGPWSGSWGSPFDAAIARAAARHARSPCSRGSISGE